MRAVDVKVVVTDKKGRPVYDLVRGDFELYVDGEPVEIRHFLAPALRAEAVSQAPGAVETPAGVGEPAPELAATDLAEPLFLVVFVDRAYLRPGETKDLEADLQGLLDQLDPRDRVMLVVGDETIEVVQPLAAPPVAIDPVFELGRRQLGRGEATRRAYAEILRGIDRTLAPEQFDPNRDVDPVPATRFLVGQINELAARASRDVEATAGQLRFLISALAGLPGRRAVLYVGGRMPLSAGQSLFSTWRATFDRAALERMAVAGAAGELVRPVDTIFDFDRANVLETADAGSTYFKALATESSARSVAFYTIDAAAGRRSASRALVDGSDSVDAILGLRTDWNTTQRAAHQQVLTDLAESTGGRTMGKRRDVAGLVDEILSDAARSYTIGFEPASEDPTPEAAEALHTIEVRLRPPHHKLRPRHRQHFRNRPADAEAAERTISALLFSAGPPPFQNPLELEVEVGAVRPGDDGRLVVTLAVKVPLARLALLAERWAHRGQLSVFFTAGGLEGGVDPVRKAVIPVRLANEEILAAFGRRVEYDLEVDVPRDARSVAVSVRDDFSPSLSTVVRPLGPGSGP